MNWKERLQNIKWRRFVKDALEIASDASDIVIHLRDKPTYTDYASIGLKITNSAMHHANKFKKRPFKGWTLIDLWEYKDFLYDLAKRHYEVEQISETDDCKSVIIKINGIEFGWMDYGNNASVSGPYVKKDVKRKDYMKVLGDMVWKSLGTNSCEIAKKKGVIEDDLSGGITVFKVDRQDNVHESKVAYEILNRAKRFLEKGYNRSILLYGTPGTGKSSMMRFIAKEFGKYSLRINVGDLDHLMSEDMLLAIELLRPSTLMIDDFDRSLSPSKFLTELEQFNNHVQLLMVSVNHVDRLEDAVVRPGRFDEWEEISTLDDEIVDKLIGDNIPSNIREKLRKMPIAFVSEFHKRRQVLGLEKALEEVVDLEMRLRNVQRMIEDPDEPVRRRKKKKKKKNKKKEIEFEVKVAKSKEA